MIWDHVGLKLLNGTRCALTESQEHAYSILRADPNAIVQIPHFYRYESTATNVVVFDSHCDSSASPRKSGSVSSQWSVTHHLSQISVDDNHSDPPSHRDQSLSCSAQSAVQRGGVTGSEHQWANESMHHQTNMVSEIDFYHRHPTHGASAGYQNTQYNAHLPPPIAAQFARSVYSVHDESAHDVHMLHEQSVPALPTSDQGLLYPLSL